MRRRVPLPTPKSGFRHDLFALSAACGALWTLLERDDTARDVASANLATWRLCQALDFCLQWTPPEDAAVGGKKGGGSKKGKGGKGGGKLVLLPVQEEALLKITGCLRHLSMLDTDKIRAARVPGVAKACDTLAMVREREKRLGN